MGPSLIKRFSEQGATLDLVGGKALSLANMVSAGFPVPPGFTVTTQAYWQFIAENHLQPQAAVREINPSSPTSLERVSEFIRESFMEARIPAAVMVAITQAYKALGGPERFVAVRSSATAEDLPEASFAGQQETYLNIHGNEAVLAAIKGCWASLWTARAIAYRWKNHVNQDSIALAVVIQEMVNAEASGVVFTVNPINGRRDEMVINATWGLGEALVGGTVTPDTIIADKATGKIKHVDVTEKVVITTPTATGTRQQPLTGPKRSTQVLHGPQVSELASLSRKIEAFYARPQDIEWCLVANRFYILQARPVTALPNPAINPPSEWRLPQGAYAAMRNNIVELMANPLSPMFATMGVSAINTSLHRLLAESFGMHGIMPKEIVITVNHYAYNNGSVTLKSMIRLVFGANRILKRMFTGAIERWTATGRPVYLKIVEDWERRDFVSFSNVRLLQAARQLSESAVDAYGALISGVIPAAWITEAIFTRVYNSFAKRQGSPPAHIFLLGYDSLPIRADKSLYRLAQWSKQQPGLAQWLSLTSTEQILSAFKHNNPPYQLASLDWQAWCSHLQQHLHEFGCTLYDLDFQYPLPIDDPTPVIDTLKLYLGGGGTNPFNRQSEAIERREQASTAVRKRLKGWQLRWFDRSLSLAQKYAPLREEGLAEIGLAYPIIRKMLLEVGRRFAEQQIISTAEDIFWLWEEEALAAATQLDQELRVEPMSIKVAERKAENKAARSIKPPMALPQLKVLGFDLMSLKEKRKGRGKGDVIKGVPASPGQVRGTARVLHGPEDFSQMQPGDILVAPITTPAWTPLFAMASAVVTDVGGPLSHGSIVAREYGIPAVLGTSVATYRIHSGQHIFVDGNNGLVSTSNNIA